MLGSAQLPAVLWLRCSLCKELSSPFLIRPQYNRRSLSQTPNTQDQLGWDNFEEPWSDFRAPSVPPLSLVVMMPLYNNKVRSVRWATQADGSADWRADRRGKDGRTDRRTDRETYGEKDGWWADGSRNVHKIFKWPIVKEDGEVWGFSHMGTNDCYGHDGKSKKITCHDEI